MELKKKRGAFFSLMRKGSGGFTLVELIVVIAILGTLGGVAIPVSTGYIKKANMAADQTLVGDVVKALQLQYYSDPINASTGYVVLRSDGATADAVGTKAMQKTFGDDWATIAALEYDGWTDDGLLELVADYSPEELENIAASTFVSVSTPESLMTAVTNMTGLVSEVVAGSNLAEATNRLNTLGMSDIANKLDALGLDPTKAEDKEAYSTAVSNLMVNELAGRLQTGNVDNPITTILFVYTSALAYAEATEDTSVLDQINANLASDAFTFDVLTSDEYMSVVGNGVFDNNGDVINQDFGAFGVLYEDANLSALISMMGAVEMISGSYSDKESLTNPGLYSSDSVSEQVNNYINSVKALSGMSSDDRAALNNLPAGSVAVFLAGDGSVAVTPRAAGLAS